MYALFELIGGLTPTTTFLPIGLMANAQLVLMNLEQMLANGMKVDTDVSDTMLMPALL